MRTVEYVYIHQFGGFWRMTLAQWLAFCERMVRDDLPEYDLDKEATALRGQPKCIRKGESYWRVTHGIYVNMPCDWQAGDWEDAVKTARARSAELVGG